ncbi:permease [Amycolatopsis echigonensis]|uniref:Permease n=1 Tax=Amycolatopsis echigonensis TaxID=2576905 RepID=A0A8E1W4H0_9PSEU|nr:permease [Amycolatopsis echigonensis]MBB2504039.1 permease [Amycolatopsis echigonensis]
MHVVLLVVDGVWSGLRTTWMLLWESLYGLTLGFLLSAVVQVVIPQQWLRRYATGGVGGIAVSAGFGAISSSCSYGSAAATRSLYRRGADARAAFAFLISSTNMNVAILVMFWVLVGWQFAFAEFFGGIIIIAVVAIGLSLLFPGQALDRLRTNTGDTTPSGPRVTEDVVCGMKGSPAHAVAVADREFLFCTAEHARQFAADPAAYADVPPGTATPTDRDHTAVGTPSLVEPQDVVCGMAGSAAHTAEHAGRTYQFCSAGCRDTFTADPGRYTGERMPERPSLRSARTWYEITRRAWSDVTMLRTELIVGYLLAGFAEALVPRQALSQALHAIGGIPVLGYVLLLLLGLAIAVATFVCSMGNVPVAAFLKAAGIPLGANTAYIYGDLLILPLVRIYQRSFPAKLTTAFLALFVLGACLAGGVMEAVFSLLPGGA